MKHYNGYRILGAPSVIVNGESLAPRFDLCIHDRRGFDWGYGGSGPAQLALALLAECLRSDKDALQIHQAFKWTFVSGLPRDGWLITDDDILEALDLCRFRKSLYRRIGAISRG